MIDQTYIAYPNNKRVSGIQCRFGIYDQRASALMFYSESNSPISKADQIMNGIIRQTDHINTLEKGMFVLDGTGAFQDQTLEEVGWESEELSDEDGFFSDPIILQWYEGGSIHKSYGFELYFDTQNGEGISDFTIETYKEDRQISRDRVKGNTQPIYISEVDSPGFDKIVLRIYKTALPFRRARIAEFKVGRTQLFDRSSARSAKLNFETSPTCENLPTNEFSLVLDNTDKKYNLINPQGLYRYLQEGQEIKVEIGVGEIGEEIIYLSGGTFYYKTASSAEGTAEITANDILTSWDEDPFLNGKLLTLELFEVLNLITEGKIELDIPETLARRKIPAGIYDVSKREAIRLAVQAARATCWMDRYNRLKVREFFEGDPVEVVTRNRLYKDAAISIVEPIDTIKVSSTDISSVVGWTEQKLLYAATIPVKGRKTIVCEYSENCVEIDTVVTGGALVDAKYNNKSADLTIEATGSVTIRITGKNIVTSQTVFNIKNPKSGDSEKVKTLINQLINADMADSCARWLIGQLQGKVQYELDERGNPAREIGDTIVIHDPFGENQRAVEFRQEWSFDKYWRVSSSQIGSVMSEQQDGQTRYAGATIAGDFS